jgi:hypothetical protein
MVTQHAQMQHDNLLNSFSQTMTSGHCMPPLLLPEVTIRSVASIAHTLSQARGTPQNNVYAYKTPIYRADRALLAGNGANQLLPQSVPPG